MDLRYIITYNYYLQPSNLIIDSWPYRFLQKPPLILHFPVVFLARETPSLLLDRRSYPLMNLRYPCLYVLDLMYISIFTHT